MRIDILILRSLSAQRTKNDKISRSGPMGKNRCLLSLARFCRLAYLIDARNLFSETNELRTFLLYQWGSFC